MWDLSIPGKRGTLAQPRGPACSFSYRFAFTRSKPLAETILAPFDADDLRVDEGKASGLRLFREKNGGVTEAASRIADVEADLQGLVEVNMEALLEVRFLASEYSTGPVHGGRIDSLGLDENGAPVIVEYKRATDPGVINQGLFYLSWPMDHEAEFRHLVRDRLGGAVADQVLWSAPG